MKAFQRILAVMLALVLSLSVLGTVAFAEEGTTVTLGTIDTTKTGSLTIHKYEYNGTDGTTGTGSANDVVPTDAAPLSGVKFKITKVAELTDYYGADGKALPTVDEAKAMTAIGEPVEGTTVDGFYTFSNLPLGLYLVQEIEAPQQITGKTPDFLVSIPMTNADGTDWLYDVHVFPKNSSTYASVTLLKQGKVGDADASALSGATFVLQEKGTDGKWTTVTENNKGVAIGTLTSGSDGKITVSDLAPGEYRFVETSVGNGYIMDGKTTYEFKIADGTTESITAGSVLINDAVVDTTQNPITVINYKPDAEKKVGASKNQAADYSVGDDIPYEITIEVPHNIAELKTFTLTDTLTNQKFNDDVSITGLTKGTEYTVSKDSDSKFTITFDTSKLTANSTLTITYTAELLSSAATTVDGNANSATLTYSNEILPDGTPDGNPNDPEDPDNPGDPDTNTITDETVVYTFELKVNKVGESDNGNVALEGVKFDVYSYSGTKQNPSEADLKGDDGKLVAQITTDSNGAATVSGLANGTYYLVETKTVDGYNLLKAPVAVTLNVSYKTTWTESNTYDEDGNLIKSDKTATEEYFGGSESAVGNNYVSQTVVNKKGFTLPQTGGLGTLMFIIIGGVLIAGGVCLITVPNKKRAV